MIDVHLGHAGANGGTVHVGTCPAIGIGGMGFLGVSQEPMAGLSTLAHVPPLVLAAWGVSLLVLAAPSHVSTILATSDGGISGIAIAGGGFHSKIDPLRKYLEKRPLYVNNL